MSMLMAIVAVGSAVSFMQLNWAEPTVEVKLNNVDFLYVFCVHHVALHCSSAIS